MSIESQANFWLRNVIDFDGGISGKHSALSAGFVEFSELLKRIYKDYRAFEVSTAERVKTKIGIMADDLENYKNLTQTIECLYYMAKTGELREEGGAGYLEINKTNFKKEFKESATFPFSMLGNHGFYFRFSRSGDETGEYKKCDTFCVFYDNNENLIRAIKYFVNEMPETVMKEDYQQTRFLFFTSDFESVLFKRNVKQTAISPLWRPILNTAGAGGGVWQKIVTELTDNQKLTTRSYILPYVFPNWTVIFNHKKKTIATFWIFPDSINILLSLSYETAKWLISNRGKFSASINAAIDNFGCCGCGKCGGAGSMMEVFEGANLCRHQKTNFMTASRCLYARIDTAEDAASLFEITQEIIKNSIC